VTIAEETTVPGGRRTSGSRDSETIAMSRTAQLIFAWCGPLMLALILFGLLLARFLPPWISPHDSAEQVAHIYVVHQDRIRAGCIFTLIGFGMIGVWGVSLAAQTRRKEGLFPVLTYAQLVTMAAGSALLMCQSVLWAVAAFRPGEISPQITMTLNDAGYIMLLSTWLPFTVWTWALGLSILLDRSDQPTYPRWSAYLSFWAGLLYIPGNTVWFVKHGVFGWRGLVCLYTPIGAFGIWVLAFTYLTIQNINKGLVHAQDLNSLERS
jgi:hypothetical protein